jgi:hypothetical protein
MQAYSVHGTIGYAGFLPDRVIVRDREISGVLGKQQADISTWRTAPHVELANMRLPASPKVLIGFFRRYGALDASVNYIENISSMGPPDIPASEMLNLGHAKLVKQDFSITVQALVEAQATLRMAWRGDRTMFVPMEQAIKRGEFLVASPVRRDDLLTTRDLWSFICYIFLLDHEQDKARICEFRDCSTPYFVKQRKDQEYCSHRCAVNDNNLRRAQASKSKSRRKTQ